VLTVVSLAHGSLRITSRALGAAHAVARPSDASDMLPVDPALRTGTLPNGMRYYIRANRTPKDRAELRLVVNAGSILEDEDQRGLAHYLEHMAFNGLKHFPKHDLIEFLENAGMRFGADLNAYTTFGETVYTITIPTDDPAVLKQGLQMLGDMAGGGITIDSNEVIAERGVIMGEWRSRLPDTSIVSAMRHQDSVLYGDNSPFVTRQTIGLTKIINNAEPAPIRRFYKDWYRPDLIAVVVVGDFDPTKVEKLIRARLSAIPAAQHAQPRPNPVLPTNEEPKVDVYRGQVNPQLQLVWKQRVHPVTTRGAYRARLAESLLLDGLSKKYLALRKQDRRPFFWAEAGRVPVETRTDDALVVQVIAQPDSLQNGLAAALTEIERVAQRGVSAPELERRKAAVLRNLESAAIASGARPSAAYASDYVQNYLSASKPLLDAQQQLAIAREVLPTITSTDLAHAAAFWHDRRNLIILATIPRWAHVRPPTRESVLAVLDSVARDTIAVDSSRELADGSLVAHSPAPGRIVHELHDARSGVTEWTLSNGARVLFKATHFDDDELLIDARSPGGFSLVPDTLFFSSGRLVAKMMTAAEGLGTQSHEGLERRLSRSALRDFKVDISNNDESIRMGGSPKDLETLFQMLYLQFTAPTLDTMQVALWKNIGAEDIQTTLDERLDYALSRGDPRRAPVPWSLVQFANVPKAMAIYRDRFSNAGDFTFTIVGAASPRQLRPLVERYVASLPSTDKREHPKQLDVEPWNAISTHTSEAFTVPKSSTFLVFDGPFPQTPEAYLLARAKLQAVAAKLELTFTDVLRERMGGTYSVGVRAYTYADPTEHFRVFINFDTAPERMNEMQDSLFSILNEVRTQGATADELRKTNALQRRQHELALQNNSYWLSAIELYDRLHIPYARISDPAIPPLTTADITAAAREFLPAQAYINMTMVPLDSTIRTPRDSTAPAPPDSASTASHAIPLVMLFR
jgi:zinc protease